MSRNEDKIGMLVSMGFDEGRSNVALANTNGNLDAAVNLLLFESDNNNNNGNSATSTANTSNPVPAAVQAAATVWNTTSHNNNKVVQASFNQYSLLNGRSACTCIALNMASQFLSMIENYATVEQLVTTSFLESNLRSGVDLYNNRNLKSNVEHLSVEEVLTEFSSTSFNVVLKGGVRQGILTNNNCATSSSFTEILTACRDGGTGKMNEWMGFVITKPPETICVCVPPKIQQLQQQQQFIVIDSHPRPQFQLTNCYAKFVPTMNDLIVILHEIFPFVNLQVSGGGGGGGGGEIMNVMYNSFDVYPLQRKKQEQEQQQQNC